MKFQDLLEEINLYDVVCLTEIKMDKNDLEIVKNEFDLFDINHNVNEEYLNHPRGGILILTKKRVKNFINYYPPNENIALFF